MTPAAPRHVEWLDALYLLGVRLVHLLTYLLTYTLGSGV